MHDSGGCFRASLVAVLLLLLVVLPLAPAAPSDRPNKRRVKGSRPSKAAVAASAALKTASSMTATPLPQLTRPPWLGTSRVFKPKTLGRDRKTTKTVKSSSATAKKTSRRPARFIVQLGVETAAAAMGQAAPVGTVQSASIISETGIRGRVTPQARILSQAVQARIAATAARAGVSSKIGTTYSFALAGFTVLNPTVAELQALAADPNVTSVTPNRRMRLNTYTTPGFLGLVPIGGGPSPQGPVSSGSKNSNNGLWDQLGGVLADTGAAEDVVIGMLDTGVWADGQTSFSPSDYWADANQARQYYKTLNDWKGQCSPKEDGQAYCTGKIVGCRYYTQSFGGDEGMLQEYPWEFRSCEDIHGHGSHTASTAGGNYGISDPDLPAGQLIGGMGPRARLAIYKVLWGDGVGWESDIVQAIEDAIKDGVDILSMSAGGDPASTFRDPTSMAFMNAARAGIFVAVAAGNSGPKSETVENIAPWTMSVAASTHNRMHAATLDISDGSSFTGSGFQKAPAGPYPLVYGGDVGSAYCDNGNLDFKKVTGSIVVCNYAAGYEATAAEEVMSKGGKGLVLVNVAGSTERLLSSPLSGGFPYVQLPGNFEAEVIAKAQTPGAKATIGAAQMVLNVTAPFMADFSSRGPLVPADGAVLKPDITAPGVEIVAATSGWWGHLAMLDGTSMSTPHIAGVATLIKDKFPRWSPMRIKSAIMTSAYQTTRTGDVGKPFGTALDYGAGHVDPAAALNPGLVFDSTYQEWQGLLCDVERLRTDDFCTKLCGQQAPTAGTAQRSNLCNDMNFNGPWISGVVFDTVTVRRTVTAILPDGNAQFVAEGSADPGSSFDVTVSPSRLNMFHNLVRPVSITITAREDTPMGEYQFGQVVWRSNKGHKVRIPIAVKFMKFLAREYVRPADRQPAFDYSFKIGAAFPVTVDIISTGLQAADVQARTLPSEGGGDLATFTITVPENNAYFAAALFDVDYTPGTDLDLYIYKDGEEIGWSEGDNSDEMLQAKNGLPAGEYTVEVNVYYYAPGETSSMVYLHLWMLSFEQPVQNELMTVSPTSVSLLAGVKVPVTLSFESLNFTSTLPPTRYAGKLGYQKQGEAAPFAATRVYLF